MSTDLSEVLRGLDGFVEHQEAQIRRGLRAAASDATAAMCQTTAHGDVTGATRAGYTAFVVGPALVDQAGALQAINAAVRAIEDKNPGRSATSTGQIGAESFGVVFTCPTDYQQDLEERNAGEKAVLTPTFAAYVDELTARAAEGR